MFEGWKLRLGGEKLKPFELGSRECGRLSKEISKPLQRKGQATQRKLRKHSRSRKASLGFELGSEEGTETRKRKLLLALELRKLVNSSGPREGSSLNGCMGWGFSRD